MKGAVRQKWQAAVNIANLCACHANLELYRPSPFRRFDTSPEVIRLGVLMYVRFPLSLRNVEDLLFERGIDLCHETVRFWWNRFRPMFAADSAGGGSTRCVVFPNGAGIFMRFT
ncbi:MAG: family transposase [Novosphingobium sp.]|nr:family transposase [Novosphingobium sp.]